MNVEDISNLIRDYLENEVFPDDAESIDNATHLISTGKLDSIATLQLVSFLEDTFDIKIKAREVGIDHMDSVENVTALVVKKQSG